jgi:thiol-disulfide isomerase/thioredoxin
VAILIKETSMRSAWRLQFVFAALLLFVAAGPPAHAKVTVGDTVPAVNLVNWDGQSVNLADLRGKVVVIDFWASWCGVCRQALPALDAIGQRFAKSGVVVVGINIDRTGAMADRFLAEHLPAPTMLLLRDPEAEVLARFGADGMPAIYVVDPNGIVRLAESGYAPERLTAVENVVAQYLPQASGRVPQ